MSEAPGSPKAGRLASPSWLDTRLVLGVLLVLLSVVVGARVLSSADSSTLVWSTTRDLARGSSLSDADLQPVQVRLFASTGRYLPATGPPPVGYVLDRPVAAGDLLPRAALEQPGVDIELRLVTVPVLPGHYPPDLQRGQRVDLWVTPDRDAALATGEPVDGGSRLVLPGLTVDQVPGEGGALGGATPERAVVLVVPPDDVGLVIDAMAGGRLDLVRVPTSRDAGELPPASGTAGG